MDVPYILGRAIMRGDLERVKDLIKEQPDLLRSVFPGDCTRSSLDPSGKTPLLLACYNDKTEIAQFLLEEEKRRKGAPTPVEQHAQVGEIPSYNMATTLGEMPAFVGRKKPASLVESFLEFDDLHVANDADDGETILWHCANRGIVSDKIVQDERVRAQIGRRVHGKLPIEEVFERGVWRCSDSASGDPEKRLRLVFGYKTSFREMVHALKDCSPDVKAMNLRAIMNYITFMAVHEPALQRDILTISGHQIISLLGENSCGLPRDEILRAKATIMKIQENTKWFDPRDKGHQAVLHNFCCAGNLEIVKYLIGFGGINDPLMEDGTTAFSMVLGKRDLGLIRLLLASEHPCDIDPKMMAKRAIFELDKDGTDNRYPSLRKELYDGLKKYNITPKKAPSQTGILSKEITEMLEQYPMQNQDSEKIWTFNKRIDDAIEQSARNKGPFQVKHMKPHIMSDLCIVVKEKSLPEVKDCTHKGKERMNCMMVQDLVTFVSILHKELQLGALRDFHPFFELVGSMAEGTRIGLANELDLGLKFGAWYDNIPFKVDGDPFSLKKGKTWPKIMEAFYNGNEFQFHKFIHYLLIAVETAMISIFETKRNPPNLKCVTTNTNWNEGRTTCEGNCKKNLRTHNFEQCNKCAVTVSQTKSGVVLQFEWEWHEHDTATESIYCSIDLIPIFPIEPIPAMKLARFINEFMLCDDPPSGWLNFLFKYVKEYKIVQELYQYKVSDVTSVGLKTMNFEEGKNHHIKPAQEFTEAKFSSERMREIYSYIKFVKKVLNLDLSSYWVKKELLKQEYDTILNSCTTEDSWMDGDKDDAALVRILSQPEFKTKMENKINFIESLSRGVLWLKRENWETDF